MTPALETALSSFLSNGPIGAVAIIALWVAKRLYDQVNELQQARLAEQMQYTTRLEELMKQRLADNVSTKDQALQLSREVFVATDKLSTVADMLATKGMPPRRGP